MPKDLTTEEAAEVTELRDSMLLLAVALLTPMLIIGVFNVIALVTRALG